MIQSRSSIPPTASRGCSRRGRSGSCPGSTISPWEKTAHGPDRCNGLLPDALLDETVDPVTKRVDIRGLKTDEYDLVSAVMFGWQFRPVLGADYVASNMRTVFAQLALPTDISDENNPDLEVYVQTRWRQYSEPRQITGPSYETTCQWMRMNDSLSIYNPIKVKDVLVDDMGGGILRVRAEGNLLSSSLTVRSGATMIPPQFFDGRQLEFFATAAGILQSGDLELLAEDGTERPIRVETKNSGGERCRLDRATLTAVPRPDGTSLVQATMTRGPNYDPSPANAGHDGEEQFKILIGQSVYGLQETPFLQQPTYGTGDSPADCAAPPPPAPGVKTPWSCTYYFTALTSALKAAQSFLVRDIAWDDSGKRGTIGFAPTFTSVASLPPTGAGGDNAADASKSTKCSGTTVPLGSTVPGAPCWFEVKGTDFSHISLPPGPTCVQEPCAPGRLTVYADTSTASNIQVPLTNSDLVPVCGPDQAIPPFDLSKVNICIVDDTTLRVAFQPVDVVRTIHMVWHQTPPPGYVPVTQGPYVDWPLSIAKTATSPPTANPPVLYVSDSRALTYSGMPAFTCFQSATFETTSISQSQATPAGGAAGAAGGAAGDAGAAPVCGAVAAGGAAGVPKTRTTLALQIPSSVTAKAGYKEIVVTLNVPTAPGATTNETQVVNLPLVVVGR